MPIWEVSPHCLQVNGFVRLTRTRPLDEHAREQKSFPDFVFLAYADLMRENFELQYEQVSSMRPREWVSREVHCLEQKRVFLFT